MIKKYELIVGIFLILLVLPSLVKADDNVYIKSDNLVKINNDFTIVNSDTIISNILIDNNSIYYYSNKNLYFVNKSNGIINYKISVTGIKNITQSNNYIFVNTNSDIYKINKFTGIIDIKYHQSSLINGIYSFFNVGSNLITNNYYNNTTFDTNHANLTNLEWSKSGHIMDSNINIYSGKQIYNESADYIIANKFFGNEIGLYSSNKNTFDFSQQLLYPDQLDLITANEDTGTGYQYIQNQNEMSFYDLSYGVLNLKYVQIDNNGLTLPQLSGSGNAYLCINSTGLLYRNNTPCI